MKRLLTGLLLLLGAIVLTACKGAPEDKFPNAIKCDDPAVVDAVTKTREKFIDNLAKTRALWLVYYDNMPLRKQVGEIAFRAMDKDNPALNSAFNTQASMNSVSYMVCKKAQGTPDSCTEERLEHFKQAAEVLKNYKSYVPVERKPAQEVVAAADGRVCKLVAPYARTFSVHSDPGFEMQHTTMYLDGQLVIEYETGTTQTKANRYRVTREYVDKEYRDSTKQFHPVRK